MENERDLAEFADFDQRVEQEDTRWDNPEKVSDTPKEWTVLAVLNTVDKASPGVMAAWAMLFQSFEDSSRGDIVQMLDKETGTLVLYQS